MRRRRICLILAILLALLSLIPAGIWLRLRNRMTEQTAAERWRGDNDARFGQVSCYLDESAALSPEAERSIRERIGTGLAGESEEAWTLSLCGFGEATVSGLNGESGARVIGTLGDYYQFHPVQMAGGAWYDQNDVNQDGVVLDMFLAWKLFGGYDLAGQTVHVNGVSAVITGVARLPEERLEQKAYGDTPTIWMSAGLMARLGMNVRITCVEAVLPDPVSHFAENQLKNAVGVGGESCDTVECTGRFSLQRSMQNLFQYNSRVMRTDSVSYPYWENAARAAESRCAILAAVTVALLLYPGLFLLYWLLRGLLEARRRIGESFRKRK